MYERINLKIKDQNIRPYHNVLFMALNLCLAEIENYNALFFLNPNNVMNLSGNWLFYTLISLSLYGLWGFFSKLGTNYINPQNTLIYDMFGALIVGLVLVVNKNYQWQGDTRGMFFSAIAGLIGAIATLCYLVAVSKNSVSIVLPVTSLYPAITVLLSSFFLKEPITLRHGMGILFAVMALIIISSSE